MSEPKPVIYVSGSNYGVIGDGNKQRVEDSFNAKSTADLDPEVRRLFDQLLVEVTALRRKMLVEDAEKLDACVADLNREVCLSAPDKGKLAVTGKGLIEAANTVQSLSSPVIATVKAILSMLGVG